MVEFILVSFSNFPTRLRLVGMKKKGKRKQNEYRHNPLSIVHSPCIFIIMSYIFIQKEI